MRKSSGEKTHDEQIILLIPLQYTEFRATFMILGGVSNVMSQHPTLLLINIVTYVEVLGTVANHLMMKYVWKVIHVSIREPNLSHCQQNPKIDIL